MNRQAANISGGFSNDIGLDAVEGLFFSGKL